LRGLVDRRLIAAGSDVIIACSQEDRSRMIERQGIAPTAVRLVPNGIDGRSPTPCRDVRAELGIASGAPVVGSVGALRAEKRFDVLLRAVSELAPRCPGMRVVIVGEGAERPRLEALAAELGLGDALLMLGARGDVPDVLEAFDVAVVSSDFEGSPLSVMEYMEAGLPVVATAVGGLPQLVHDGVHGVLVPRREPSALAAAIEALVADPERGRALGAAGRERRRAEFDVDIMVGRVESLYEELYAARTRGGRLR
jgi:glycosyltransferase involved in cell wall biosynthesis